MQQLRSMQQKESITTNSSFVPFYRERDKLGNLVQEKPHKRFKSLEIKKRKQALRLQQTNSTHSTKSKINFLIDHYTINHNSVWANLTHVSRLKKNINLKIVAESVPQKPLTLLNQKLQLNQLCVIKKTQQHFSNTPRLGKSLNGSVMPPPFGYYELNQIIKKSPMLVKMNLQGVTNRSTPQLLKTEPSQSSTCQKLVRPQRYLIPQTFYDKAYETERQLTDQKCQYIPQFLDNKELETTINKINQLRQFYLDIKNCSE